MRDACHLAQIAVRERLSFVGKNWQQQRLTLESASTADVGDVLAVLDEAAAWLKASGVDQWPDRFKSTWVEPAIERGETWLARLDGVAAGTITLDWDDPLWSDLEGEAGYVHRMAIRRSSPGLGAALLDWAVATTGALGCGYLRLDCVTSNNRLRSYYESKGFHHQGDVPVGGAPGQRADDGPVTWVSLYQLPV
jgi:GNAT superfamily N-acetyltransferase